MSRIDQIDQGDRQAGTQTDTGKTSRSIAGRDERTTHPVLGADDGRVEPGAAREVRRARQHLPQFGGGTTSDEWVQEPGRDRVRDGTPSSSQTRPTHGAVITHQHVAAEVDAVGEGRQELQVVEDAAGEGDGAVSDEDVPAPDADAHEVDRLLDGDLHVLGCWKSESGACAVG